MSEKCKDPVSCWHDPMCRFNNNETVHPEQISGTVMMPAAEYNELKMRAEQSTQQLELLDEAIEYCSNLRYSEQREMMLMWLTLLRQRTQEQKDE